jgi:hypothetical protein
MKTINKNITGNMIIAFLILISISILGIGQSLGADIGMDSDDDNGIFAQGENVAPEISNFTLSSQPGGLGDNLLGAQLNVNTEYYFRFTVEDVNGWDDIGYDGHISIDGWYDNGDDSTQHYEQISGPNYKFRFIYADWDDNTSVPSYYETEHSYGTVVLGNVSITEEIQYQKYTFEWPVIFDKYTKQADALVGTGSSYDDANSWNFRIEANDGEVSTYQQNNGTHAFEFGIYKYTYVSVGGNWALDLTAPGESATTVQQTISHSSNDDFDITMWFDTELYSQDLDESISVDNIKVLGSTTNKDDVNTNTPFSGLGEANELTLLAYNGYGDHSAYYGSSMGSTNTPVSFEINIPYGTLSGAYAASMTVQITQVD